MDLPFYLEIGPVSLHPHLVFEVLAFFVGFRYVLHLRKGRTDPIKAPDRIWIIIGATAGALVGSRLLGGLENPALFFGGGGEAGLLYYYQQKTIVGALLGGLICVELTKKWLGVRVSSGDLFTFPLILGILVGRIGCFLSGVEDGTHGLPSAVPWAMDLGDGLLRHPAALYEILFLVLLWLGLYLIEQSYILADGVRFKLFMVGYLLFRLGVDTLKPGFRFEIGLTTIQIACILGLIYYYKVFLYPKRLVVGVRRARGEESKTLSVSRSSPAEGSAS